MSGWTRALIVAGGVSVGGLFLRLLFLFAPVRVSDAISRAFGIGLFGTIAVMLGFGLACLGLWMR